NQLYLAMARATEVLKPFVVIIENVPAVEYDKSGVVKLTVDTLISAGYDVAARPVDFGSVGVPQRRRRFLLVASRVRFIDPASALSKLTQRLAGHRYRSVRWAIGDLTGTRSDTVFDSSSSPNAENLRRIEFLFEHD